MPESEFIFKFIGKEVVVLFLDFGIPTENAIAVEIKTEKVFRIPKTLYYKADEISKGIGLN